VGTKEFAEAVVARLGQRPEKLKAASYAGSPKQGLGRAAAIRTPEKKEMVGADVFIDWSGAGADDLGNSLKKLEGGEFNLSMIDNRGVKVWPGGFSDTLTGDVWRCRFEGVSPSKVVTHEQITALLDRISKAGFDFIKIESLCNFDGKPGYSLGQGQ
jgi:isocitrate dehydrogenase